VGEEWGTLLLGQEEKKKKYKGAPKAHGSYNEEGKETTPAERSAIGGERWVLKRSNV